MEPDLEPGTAGRADRIASFRQELLPRTLFVPRPYSGLLQKLRHPPDDDDRQETRPPRFTATVCWGADYEPWVSSVRLLP